MSYFDRYTDAYWDRERDYRKHEPRPTDPPARSDPDKVPACEPAIELSKAKVKP